MRTLITKSADVQQSNEDQRYTNAMEDTGDSSDIIKPVQQAGEIRGYVSIMYGIMTEELVMREIRIDEAAGRSDSDSRMTSFEVIMPLKLQSTKILIYSV